MATNDFLPFATGVGADVEDQASWVAEALRLSGFLPGLAQRLPANKAWRQSSVISHVVAQFIADQTGADVLDDGDFATLEANLLLAIQGIAAASAPAGQCRLNLAGGNLALNPYGGNKLKINGKMETIPAASVIASAAALGIVAPVATTNFSTDAASVATINTAANHGYAVGNAVWINATYSTTTMYIGRAIVTAVPSPTSFKVQLGTANIALTTLTGVTGKLYYIYAYMNAGVMALEASAVPYAMDVSGGSNTGVMTKTGDGTRTLVGMCRPNNAGALIDTTQQRFVLSWFNRLRRFIQGASWSAFTTTSATVIELGSGCRMEFLSWSGDGQNFATQTQASNNTAGNACSHTMNVDGIAGAASIGGNMSHHSAANGYIGNLSYMSYASYNEGYHQIIPSGFVSGGTGTFNGSLYGMIEG